MGLFVDIKIIPSSGRQKIVLDKSGILKCYLKSAPEKGKANDEFIKFLSEQLALPKNLISLVSGRTSRKKRVKIDQDIEYLDLIKKLGLEE
ncbi:hypothetical protein GF385_01680 [Candidatus Dependentiae bacterium]|nr:hypothetical protein [Candidatus Dependentiae bacterium]